jgi:protein O-GlcNAc transferase
VDERRRAVQAFEQGAAHQRASRFEIAEQHYRNALATDPDLITARIALGDLLRRQQRIEEATSFLESAAQAAPQSAQAIGNLALLRIEQARYADAAQLARLACQIEPAAARWWIAAGVAARRIQDPDAAVPALRRACELAPDNAATWLELAIALERTADPASRDALSNAHRLAPHWERVRWLQLLQLPSIVGDEREARAAVDAFQRGIAELERSLQLDTHQGIAAALDAALGVVTFPLHYLPGDHTVLQRRFGAVIERVVAAAAPRLAAPVDWQPLAHGGRLRVGFVSAYLYTHSVTRYFGSWLTGLDRSKIETFVWHCGDVVDACTGELELACDHFSRAGKALGENIRAARLDVLILLDVGLDPRLQVLAAMRLACRQYLTFGHPVTSGLSTLDGFLGAELLEAADSQQQYSERLIRLPGLATRFRRRAEPGDASWLRELAGGRPVLMCLQNLIKLQPAFDELLARVVAGTGAMLVLFEHSAGQSVRFRERFARAVSKAQLDFAADVRIIHALPYRDWLAGVAAAALVLDTKGFSGGVSSLDAIGVGTPVVTFEGTSARGRQTAAMLKIVGVPELIVRDDDEYVRLATTIVHDTGLRARLRQRLLANASRLFDDVGAVESLQQFLLAPETLEAGKNRPDP